VKAGLFGLGVGWFSAECRCARRWVGRWEDGDGDKEVIYVSTNDGQCHGDRRNREAPPKRGEESRKSIMETRNRKGRFWMGLSFLRYDD
jgi:hypothetical protein